MSKTYWWNNIKEQKINNAFSNIVIPNVSKPEEVDYNKIDNKPSINNVELIGNKSIDSLGLASTSDLDNKQDKISDLDSIRAGAEAGITAVQPEAITDMETKTHASSIYQSKLTTANAGTNVTITEESGVVKISATGGSGSDVSSVNGKTGAVVLNAEDVGAVKYKTDYELPSTLEMNDSGLVSRTYETGSIIEKAMITYDGPDPNATYDPEVGGMVFEIVNEDTFNNYIMNNVVNPAGIVKNVPKMLRVVLTNTEGEEYPYSIYFYNENNDLVWKEEFWYDDDYLEPDVGLMWNPNVGSGDYPILSTTSTGFVITVEIKDAKDIKTKTVGFLVQDPKGKANAVLASINGVVQWKEPTPIIGTVTATLIHDVWTNNTQSVYLGRIGVNLNSDIIVSPDPNSQKTYTDYGIKCISQGIGTLTFQCDEQPDIDVMVNILYINK